MKKIELSLIAVCVLILSSCAQKISAVKNIYPFIIVSTPGRAMADDNGNTINPKPIIERFIYIECKGANQPLIDTILYNGNTFKPVLTKVEGQSVQAGINDNNGEPVMIKTAKGNTLWRIELQTTGSKELAVMKTSFSLQIKSSGKKYVYSKTETKLRGPDMY